MPFNQEAFIENVKALREKQKEYYVAVRHGNNVVRNLTLKECVSLEWSVDRMLSQHEEEQGVKTNVIEQLDNEKGLNCDN